jgi:nucleoid-associated protein YgaU
MFGSRSIASGVVLLAVVSIVLGVTRTSSGAAPGARVVVRPGDSLWAIAERHYDGNTAELVERIYNRNRLDTAELQPGQVLELP